MGEDELFGFILDKYSSVEEEKSFDISKNNLETLDDFIQFFEAFGNDVNNKKNISNYLDKLEYLGYSFQNRTIFDYANIDSIKIAIIQFAFLINLSMNENNKYEIVKICFFTCLNLLKEYNK